MHGNVWGWVENCYRGTQEECQARVLRGGSWYRFAGNARSADRSSYDVGTRDCSLGFRVLCSSHIGIFSARCPQGCYRNCRPRPEMGRWRR
jgi:hypothetical protein